MQKKFFFLKSSNKMEEITKNLSSSCIYGESFCEEGGEIIMCMDKGYKYVCYNEQEYCPDKPFKFRLAFDYFDRGDVSFEMESECFAFTEKRQPSIVSEELKDAIFTYSSPSQFPDIVHAKKSVFGSIFVRISVRKGITNINEWKLQQDDQYSMTPLYLNSFDWISDESDMENSIFRAFKKLGIFKYITSSDSQWDIFPIIKSSLCSFRIQDRVHHTRTYTKVEERIANGTVQILNFLHYWPTGSSWTGHWDGLGMAGSGTYCFPDDVFYFGKMQDGLFHDEDASLIYPNGIKVLHCNYVAGKLTDYQFQFPDNLDHEKENWKYCLYPDRRFWSEIQYGLKPARTAQRTHEDLPRRIPENCYDTNDGFYNPKTKMVVDVDNEFLRVPTCKEDKWIKDNCRRTFRVVTGFRPDLYENWYNNNEELINALLNMQKMYEDGLITYEELYEFYGDCNILSSSSPFRKKKRESQLEFEKLRMNSPTVYRNLVDYRLKKIYEGEQYLKREKSEGSIKKQKPSKKCILPKCERNPLLDKLSGKKKILDNNNNNKMMINNMNHKKISSTFLQPFERKYSKPTQPITAFSFAYNKDFSSESNMSLRGRKVAQEFAKEIISGLIYYTIYLEREKHRNQFIRTQNFHNLPFGARDKKERCVQSLEKLYWSIPDKDEFCDSVPDRTCDLKKLAEDKFQSVRYWGKRIFNLNYKENQ